MTLLAVVVAVLAALLAIWFALSYASMRRRRPLFATIYEYQQALFRRFGFADLVDPAAFEYTALPVGDGVTLSLYTLHGPPGSPVVVFMPGTAVYAQFYSTMLFALRRKGFTVVSYDPRGHGESGRLRGYFTLQHLVDDARAVCAHARERFGSQVAFSGSSQGGVTALYVAATGDPNVATVVCHNFAIAYGREALEISVFKPPLWLLPAFVRLFRAMRAFVAPVTFYLPFNRLRLPDGQPATPLLLGDPMTTTSYSLGAVASLADTRPARPVEEIATPVMLVSSTKDEVFPVEYQQRIFDRLTCPKEFLLIPDRGHLMFLFDADKPWLIDPIAAWLDKHLRGAQAKRQGG